MGGQQVGENPGEAVCESILRLYHNQDFKIYQGYIKDLLERNRMANDFMTGDQRAWNQGWSQCLSFLIGVPETLAKNRKNNSQK